MKWFQHQSNASDDIKIKRIEKEFGVQGYAFYFKLLEIIAKEGEGDTLNLDKYPLELLSKSLSTQRRLLDKWLTFSNFIKLIVLEKDKISVPNLEKYSDIWSKRSNKGRTKFELSSKQVSLDKNRIEENIPTPSKSLVVSSIKGTAGGSEVHFIIDYFSKTVERFYHYKPVINGGKDGALIKRALKEVGSKERVVEIIDYYLDSDKCKKLGEKLSVALSADTITMWKRDTQAIV